MIADKGADVGTAPKNGICCHCVPLTVSVVVVQLLTVKFPVKSTVNVPGPVKPAVASKDHISGVVKPAKMEKV